MMKITILLKILMLSVIPSFAQVRTENIALRNCHYLDVVSGEMVGEVTLILRDGVIQEIAPDPEIPDETLIIDLKGKYVLPGLIDAHVHFFQSGGLYTRPDAIDLRDERPYEEEREWVKENFNDLARRYLQVGITTVMDMGGPMSNYTLREIAKQDPNYPDLYTTGPLISTYQPEAFAIDDPPIIRVTGGSEGRGEVRKQLPFRPDFIKIWYIERPGLPADSTYAWVRAVVEEAHLHALPVAVHATQLHTAKLAVKAGADFLVHSVDDRLVDREFIRMLKEREVPLIPTLMVSSKYNEVFTGHFHPSKEDLYYANPYALGSLADLKHLQSSLAEKYRQYASSRKAKLERADSIRLENLRRLSEAGVIIATGTDAGNIGTQHGSSYYEEMRRMKRAGLSNAEIWRASTIHAARVLNLHEKTGSIEKGKNADLIICSVNPLDKLSLAENIEYIIKNGFLFRPDTLLRPSPEILVQQQLNAYNARDIDAFLEVYADDVEIYGFPDKLSMKGLDQMRSRYGEVFRRLKNLHCEVKNRLVTGNIVIDHESVQRMGRERIEAIAIYKIERGKIAKVYFIDPEKEDVRVSEE